MCQQMENDGYGKTDHAQWASPLLARHRFAAVACARCLSGCIIALNPLDWWCSICRGQLLVFQFAFPRVFFSSDYFICQNRTCFSTAVFRRTVFNFWRRLYRNRFEIQSGHHGHGRDWSGEVCKATASWCQVVYTGCRKYPYLLDPVSGVMQ